MLDGQYSSRFVTPEKPRRYGICVAPQGVELNAESPPVSCLILMISEQEKSFLWA